MKHTRTEQILNIKVLMVLQNKNMNTVYFLLLFNGKFIPHSNIKKYSVMSTTEPPSVFSISEWRHSAEHVVFSLCISLCVFVCVCAAYLRLPLNPLQWEGGIRDLPSSAQESAATQD